MRCLGGDCQQAAEIEPLTAEVGTHSAIADRLPRAGPVLARAAAMSLDMLSGCMVDGQTHFAARGLRL